MSNTTIETKLFARWERPAPPADRWQALQSRLPEITGSVASHWTRRSFVTLKWHAHPADVSTAANDRNPVA